jgi:hypothetical protein
MATIGHADEINAAVPIYEPPPLLHSQGRCASNTRTTEPQWPMQEPLLVPPEPLVEPFVGLVIGRPHVPFTPYTVDALIVTNDRGVE